MRGEACVRERYRWDLRALRLSHLVRELSVGSAVHEEREDAGSGVKSP